MRSKIASKIYNETPESIKNEVREMANAIVFDANTFGPDEVPVEYKAGFSTRVLVDMDGNRDNFLVGKYDHIEYKWKFLDGVDRDTELIRWSFLPLAIYDTNPELRKTVKI